MNLFDLLANAQGGNGIEALARQFNLSQQQTQQAVEALLPAFSQGLKENAADPYGFGSFLSALSTGQHARYFEDSGNAFSVQGLAEGNSILGHLFGSKEVSRAVSEQASQATGIGQQVLKQMLPAIAAMLMGGMFKQTNSQMAAGGFGQSSNNPLGELIEQMMRQGGGQQTSPQAPQQSQGGADNPFGKMLEDILGGSAKPSGRPAGKGENPLGNNPLGEILGQILRGGQPQGAPQPRQPSPRPTPDAAGENPWGDILGQILKGGQPQAPTSPGGRGAPADNPFGEILDQILRGGQPGADTDTEQPAPSPRRTTRSNNPLEDIFGKMVEPGKQVGDDYQQGIDSIFKQYRRGMDRYR